VQFAGHGGAWLAGEGQRVGLAEEDNWWAVVDDYGTLPLGQIVAGISQIEEISLL
jgi:hypothetical protein